MSSQEASAVAAMSPPPVGPMTAAATGVLEKPDAAAWHLDFSLSAAVKLAVVGGHRLLRDATATLLASQNQFEIYGVFESPGDLLGAAEGDREPTVVLLDCDTCEQGELPAVVGALSTGLESARVVMLCRAMSKAVARCVLEHDVRGVVLKNVSIEELKTAVLYAASGHTVMPAGWQRVAAPVSREGLSLSARHRQILALIARGHKNDEIAAELALSTNTVKFHIRALYSRLGVRNRVEASNRYAQMTEAPAELGADL